MAGVSVEGIERVAALLSRFSRVAPGAGVATLLINGAVAARIAGYLKRLGVSPRGTCSAGDESSSGALAQVRLVLDGSGLALTAPTERAS